MMAIKKVNHLVFAQVDTRYPITADLICIDGVGTDSLDGGVRGLIVIDGHTDHALSALSTIDLQGVVTLPAKVLVVFEQGDIEKPIITGVIQQTFGVESQQQPSPEDQALRSTRKLTVAGKTLHIGADQDILIECGKSSIRMTRLGKIILKGTDIVSRATRNNKIKGSSINLN